jgi:dienelactone hydrolase
MFRLLIIRVLELFVITTIALGSTAIRAQPVNGTLQPPGFVGSVSGNGQWPALAQSRADLRSHTLYRPVDLPATPLPVLLWGNGGCSDNGLGHSYFLREIASHGYLVVALGYATSERPLEGSAPPAPPPAPRVDAAPPPAPGPDATSVEQHYYTMDWLAQRNADPLDELHDHVDLSRIAVAGHSCGGLQAIKTAADPRIDTAMIFNSGVYNTGYRGISGINVSKDELNNLHGPVAYITGGPTDIAHVNSVDDVSRINHVPVFFGWLPVGHGGTFWKADDGAEWAEVAVHWLDWQFRGDAAAGRWFTGADCALCQAGDWTVERYIEP